MLEHVRALGVGGTWAGAERIVVAINELAGGEGLVRAGKRVATACAGRGRRCSSKRRVAAFSDAQHARVAAAMTLATQLVRRS